MSEDETRAAAQVVNDVATSREVEERAITLRQHKEKVGAVLQDFIDNQKHLHHRTYPRSGQYLTELEVRTGQHAAIGLTALSPFVPHAYVYQRTLPLMWPTPQRAMRQPRFQNSTPQIRIAERADSWLCSRRRPSTMITTHLGRKLLYATDDTGTDRIYFNRHDKIEEGDGRGGSA